MRRERDTAHGAGRPGCSRLCSPLLPYRLTGLPPGIGSAPRRLRAHGKRTGARRWFFQKSDGSAENCRYRCLKFSRPRFDGYALIFAIHRSQAVVHRLAVSRYEVGRRACSPERKLLKTDQR